MQMECETFHDVLFASHCSDCFITNCLGGFEDEGDLAHIALGQVSIWNARVKREHSKYSPAQGRYGNKYFQYEKQEGLSVRLIDRGL